MTTTNERWVSVDDKCPDHRLHVQVYLPEHPRLLGAAYYENGKWYNLVGSRVYSGITHWREIVGPVESHSQTTKLVWSGDNTAKASVRLNVGRTVEFLFTVWDAHSRFGYRCEEIGQQYIDGKLLWRNGFVPGSIERAKDQCERYLTELEGW
jgi:hypothetical protein